MNYEVQPSCSSHIAVSVYMHMGAVVTAASVHEAQSSRRYSTLTAAIGSLDLDLIEAKRSYY